MKSKRILFALTSALLCGMLAATSFAADLPTAAAEAKQTYEPPVIDGNYSSDEGWGEPIVTISGDKIAGCLSLCATGHDELLTDDELIPSEVNVYMRWDYDCFYYCAVQNVKTHYNTATADGAGALWKGSSMIYNIKSSADVESKTRIQFGLNNDGQVLLYQETAEDDTAVAVGGDNALAGYAIKRDEAAQTTVYEIAFKWSTIMPSGNVTADQIFAFRDLMLPNMSADYENPVDYNPAGITSSGDYNYWAVKLVPTVMESAAESEPEAVETVPAEVTPITNEVDNSSPVAETAVQTSDYAVAVSLAFAFLIGASAIVIKKRK